MDESGSAPLVSVIIATYNWSAVLRYAIQSVLWQTERNFELLVIGDGCTDDSEAVTRSFGDARVRWHNLPTNSGNQSAPNNAGIELARGEYVAYLGHDDVWHPDHLALLSGAITRKGADGAFSIAEMILAPPRTDRFLMGISASGVFEDGMHAVPSSFMHRRAMVVDLGGWRDYRTIRLPPDVEFISRAHRAGKKLVAVNELTVFKIPSSSRKNAYIDRPANDQAEFIRRIQTDPDFRYQELRQTLISLAKTIPALINKPSLLEGTSPGALVEQWRAYRGLEPQPALPMSEQTPLYSDLLTLRFLNRKNDLGPLRDRQYLHLTPSNETPPDGLFLGDGWYDWEINEWGQITRWAKPGAEIVITKPAQSTRRLWITCGPGPSVGYAPFTLRCLDREGNVIAECGVEQSPNGPQRIAFAVPLPDVQGAVLRLETNDGGQQIESDPRIMNFFVSGFGWDDG